METVMYGAGILFIIVTFLLILLVLMRIRQFSQRYQVLDYLDGITPRVIILLDFYRDSRELRERLLKIHECFSQLEKEGGNPVVLLTTGQLKGEPMPLAVSNARTLIELGVPKERVVVYLGDRLSGTYRFSRRGKGAADTYEEVLLACEWLRQHGISTAYVVTNLSQAFHAYYIALFQRVLLHPILVSHDLFEPTRSYNIGKLFQTMFLFFDPTGRNPLFSLMRIKRRYFSNAV